MQAKGNSASVFDLGPALPEQHVNLEVDKGRQRDYRRWVLAGLVLLCALVFDVWQRNQTFSRGARLEVLRAQRAEAEALGRHLRLEIATLRSPARIEQIALNRLHLVAPTRDTSTVIPLVVPSDQPPSSVVASR
jgi:cell division protein FtsL